MTSGHEVKILAGRRIAVTSQADFNGQFELSYTVSDGLDVAEARATITVTPTNDAPVATPVTVATGLDLPVSQLLLVHAEPVRSPGAPIRAVSASERAYYVVAPRATAEQPRIEAFREWLLAEARG